MIGLGPCSFRGCMARVLILDRNVIRSSPDFCLTPPAITIRLPIWPQGAAGLCNSLLLPGILKEDPQVPGPTKESSLIPQPVDGGHTIKASENLMLYFHAIKKVIEEQH